MKTSFMLVLVTLLMVFTNCGEQTSTPKPEDKTVKLFRDAENGDAVAQLELSRRYAVGDGVPRDSTKAVEWLEKAALQGNALAQGALASMYYTGDGVPKDLGKAFGWFEKAAAQGDAGSQYWLGRMYANGDGVPKNAAKAVEWFEKAAIQGNAEAQFNLARAYARGDGVPKNAAKALEWLEKAAIQGNAEAQRGLGFEYSRGDGVPRDSSKAVEWYQKAAAQGDAGAQYLLGDCYFRGNGIGKDFVLAYAWWNIAAASGQKGSKDVQFFRDSIEHGLTNAERAEGQRLSSNWKPGMVLTRGSASAISGRSKASERMPGALIQRGTGTGFLISPSGHILTNLHVVDGCAEIRIAGCEGVAKLVVADSANDLAVLQIPGETKDFARLIPDPSKLRQGEDIVVYGYPLNAVLSSGGNLSLGVVSAMTGLGNNTNQIQITAPIQPGSSGSPVLNRKGHVVGIVSMKLSELKTAMVTGSLPQNVNFAVNSQTVTSFLNAHKVPYKTGSNFFVSEKSTADLAEEARKWTVIVECWK